MKVRREFVPITVGLLNFYYVILWIKVYNLFPTQDQKVNAFLKYWLFFNSIGSLHLFIVTLTLASLVFINFKPLKSDFLRLTFSTIHIIFLFLIAFSYL
jgi:hypothetical protein